jgi:hypothetical protein
MILSLWKAALFFIWCCKLCSKLLRGHNHSSLEFWLFWYWSSYILKVWDLVKVLYKRHALGIECFFKVLTFSKMLLVWDFLKQSIGANCGDMSLLLFFCMFFPVIVAHKHLLTILSLAIWAVTRWCFLLLQHLLLNLNQLFRFKSCCYLLHFGGLTI